MQKTKEVRYAEVKASKVNDMVLCGRAIAFEEATTIMLPEGGSYTEIIHRGALDQCDLTDSTLIYNHDSTRVPLARTGSTMALNVTDNGLWMRAELAGESAQAREIYASVRRGDLRGLSFAFTVPSDGSHFDATTNTRHITKIAKVYEISICPFPAYAGTSVEARNHIVAARDAARAQAQKKAMHVSALARAKRILEIG